MKKGPQHFLVVAENLKAALKPFQMTLEWPATREYIEGMLYNKNTNIIQLYIEEMSENELKKGGYVTSFAERADFITLYSVKLMLNNDLTISQFTMDKLDTYGDMYTSESASTNTQSKRRRNDDDDDILM